MSHELVSLLGLGASVVHVAQMDGVLHGAMARSGRAPICPVWGHSIIQVGTVPVVGEVARVDG